MRFVGFSYVGYHDDDDDEGIHTYHSDGCLVTAVSVVAVPSLRFADDSSIGAANMVGSMERTK